MDSIFFSLLFTPTAIIETPSNIIIKAITYYEHVSSCFGLFDSGLTYLHAPSFMSFLNFPISAISAFIAVTSGLGDLPP